MKYPELDKIKSVGEKSQAIGEFIEWLPSQKMHICTEEYYDGGTHYEPTRLDINRTLEKFFSIDGAKAERERTAILHELRDELEVKTEDGQSHVLGIMKEESK